ncbi:hypothetical protein BGZ61DRAFT_366339 [Ilyonectria robusta]|uniref:uncharacterized protein n=1 Tax=Ilyonectria robusta TaxID=1079257 RepID=UPI001E8D83CD|nr:uncharacterized protein BGZ61DRAFT_366339 [Ilyonectria robusta]KAH8665632.1 hypothetical protein BGZ61DRAFT_366339 [Ilyonectria robusta]
MKSFGTNCTLPPDGVGFVSSPNTRGTLDILWTCLSVLLICTWSILHLNVPMQSTPNGKAQKYLRSAHRLFWKLMWMMANVIAPEWPFGKAWADYLSVSSVEKRFEELKEEDQVHWSRTHCYFANMGGIAIKFEESTKTSPKMPHETSTARFASSLYHWLCNLTLLGGDLWVLDANQILLARELGILEQLPSLHEDDVEDRNKGDLFVKIVAVVQIGWFFIQMGARLKKGFATSQLEILTLAYAICTAITYLLLLDQPKDVQYSVIISATRYPTYKELIRLAAVGPTSFWQPRKNVWIPNTAVHADTRRFGAGRDTTLAMGTAFAVFLLGSLHCVAWEFVFPTEVERTLWRASSIITALAMPAGLATNMIVRSIWNCACGSRVSGTFVRPRAQNAATGFSDLTFALIFVAARIFTIVEVLRSLAFLPSDAFVTTWSSNLPHIGS